VWLNARRRSTEGWNLDNVVLDFTGGVLSIAQLVLDAVANRDWSAVTGDPVKFGLGFASMVFDTIFMLQHWVCYRPRRAAPSNVAPSGQLFMVAPARGNDGPLLVNSAGVPVGGERSEAE